MIPRSGTALRIALILLSTSGSASLAADPPPPPFLAAKTVFQTNMPYHPGIALAVDAVIVHRHGAHATGRRLDVPGPLVDLFDPDLPVRDSIRLEPGASGLYRRVERGAGPRVLHTTHRLMEELHEGKASRVVLRGPEGTPAVVRLHLGAR